MKKTYQMILALVLCVLGAMNVSAERISLQEVPFCSWDGWTDASKTATLEFSTDPQVTENMCLWIIGQGAGNVYGDVNVINYADLSTYTKLIVVATEGTPRFLFNRDIDEGQWDADEANSHLIDNTKGGWCAKYFTSEASEEGTVYTVDVKQLVKDKGYAHLHAIKGANWANVTILSMEVERQGKVQQIGWTNLLNNSDLEGDDVSSFFSKEAPSDEIVASSVEDGIGVDGSHGIIVRAGEKYANAWDSQFWFRFNEAVLPDAKYRVSFDYKADYDAKASTQAHAEPGDCIHYEMLGDVNFTTDWQHFTKEGVVSAQQSTDAKKFLSVAFNLNEFESANNYYFDNIVFEIYKVGTSAEFSNDVIQIHFGFDTNIPELVEQAKKATYTKRIFLPTECASVKVNGQNASIATIEGLDDGRLYIFLDEPIDDTNAEVEVTFNNPAGEYHLTYTSGPNAGTDVANFQGMADYNDLIEENDGYPYLFVTPTLMKADPEDGSFNLPNDISEFKLFFDKKVECGALVATINGQALTVTPNEGFAQEVTLTHSGSFVNGDYTVNVTKVYPEMRLADDVFGTYEFTVSIGEIVADPNDVPRDIVSVDNFNNCAAGAIPEGYFVKFGQEDRPSGSTAGSGPRMFDFAAGGDFTKGLYFREGYVEYGSTENYPLQLEADKKYVIHFNTAMWKDNGPKTRFQVMTTDEEPVFTQMIDNKLNVNGSQNAVNGSTVTEINFVPETSGNYLLRWTSAGDETSAPGFNEIILANASVKYMPNTNGLEYVMKLNNALEEAKKALEENGDERYQGDAYDKLSQAISMYDGQKYTSPSAYLDAVAALEEATQALKDHRALCDDYDTQIKKAIDVVRQNAEKKFAATELYAELTTIVGKYNGTSEWVNISEDEENPEWQLNYSYDVLKEDALLSAAVVELKTIANTTSLLFTEGESKTSDTGVKVAIERLRLGAETLKALGDTENPLIEQANNALTDDDALAESLKTAIKRLVYGRLKDADNDMFAEKIDEQTYESTTPVYDMTVFVKNPNIYKLSNSVDFNEESVPGWITPEGYSKPGLSVGWGQSRGTEQIAEDCMFQTWGGQYRVQQTIVDLPAGVYTIKFGFGERCNPEAENDNDKGIPENSKVFAYGSDEVAVEALAPYIGQSFPYANLVIEEPIVVTDGMLTIGAEAFGEKTHTFFSDVRVVMTAAAADYNYAQAYEDGIETLDAQPAKVRAIELFDLNGRRLLNAPRGVAIVKKHMADGTIQTEKVVKK